MKAKAETIVPLFCLCFFDVHLTGITSKQTISLLPDFASIPSRWNERVPFYKRYIDDGFGIWYHHPDPAEDARLWQAFQDDFNDWHGLEWEFVGPNDNVDFMDIIMKIKAVDNAKKYLRTAKAEESKRRVFLHLPYHPNDPPSSTVQQLWREHMLHPIGLTPLNHVENDCKERIPIDRLTIAYSRAPNFGNMFSVRKIRKHPGTNVSSFIG
eukprot:scaffold13845_cov42-Cyclotella_meneghiniana.AAC.4